MGRWGRSPRRGSGSYHGDGDAVMKRVMVVVLLVLVASMAFGKSVAEADGTDWMRWPPQIRQWYVIGYVSGVYTALAVMHEAHGDEMEGSARQVFRFLERLGRVPLEAIVHRLTVFYSEAENQPVPIWQAIFLIPHPEWDTGQNT